MSIKIWMSRTEGWDHYDFWNKEPTVSWRRKRPRIGLYQINTDADVTSIWDLHRVLPKFYIPKGTYIVLEVNELEKGYHIGVIEGAFESEGKRRELYISHSMHEFAYEVWTELPEVIWQEPGKDEELLIGLHQLTSDIFLTRIIRLGELLPKLYVPFGEYITVEVVELENGYYIGVIE